MNQLSWTLLALLAMVWSMAYFNASIRIWTAGIAGFLMPSIPTLDQWSNGHSLMMVGLLTVALIFNWSTLRIRVISQPIMGLFRKALPTLSSTEKEALEAGTVWWDRELFNGQPNWQRLLSHPQPILTHEEQAFLNGPVERLCDMLNDWNITSKHNDLPEKVWNHLKRERFFGMCISKGYGGLGFSAQAHSAVVAKISGRSVTAAVTVMVPNSLGPAELLRHYGTEEQRTHYLPKLADGREIPCFALTSPEAGSDAGAMPDRGVVVRRDYNGKHQVVGILLNWNKRYITLAPIATLLGLAFKLDDPDHLLGDQTNLGITLALIPTNTPNITIGQRHNPLDVPFLNGPTQGKDVFIPLEWIIGGPDRVGQGWRMLMDCLSEGRAISLPALSAGAAKTATRVVGNYARVRKQFGLPIGRFEGIQEVLGRMAGQTYLMESARRFTASAVDLGEKPSVISALTKYQMTERMRLVVNDAMDIVGGAGISLGPKNLLGRLYQSIPIGITVEGANILTRTLIVFGQGAVRAHPFLLKELHALDHTDAKQGSKDFDQAFFAHIGFAVSNVARSLWLGLTNGRPHQAPVSGPEKVYYRHLTRLCTSFAMAADMALLMLGGSLKRRESLSGRMADMLSHLYLASATLKRFYDEGSLQEDRPLLDWAMHHHLHGAQESLYGFLANFPFRPIAWILQRITFPLGRAFSPPSDHQTTEAAKLLLEPGSIRNRLTDGIYLPENKTEPLAMLEEAIKRVIQAEPLELKIRHFINSNKKVSGEDAIHHAVQAKILTPLEAQVIHRANKLRKQVIQVDDFNMGKHYKPQRIQERAA